MKSLNNNNDKNIVKVLDNKLITEEICLFLRQDGFEFKPAIHSYTREKLIKSQDLKSWAFVRVAAYSDSWPVIVFVRDYGIEIDLDYECGGNFSTHLFLYSDYEGFDKTYDAMVDKVFELIPYDYFRQIS